MPAAGAHAPRRALSFPRYAVGAQSRRASFICARPRAGVSIVGGTLRQRYPCYFNVAVRSVARFQYLNISMYALPVAEYRHPAPSSGGGVAPDDVALRPTESICYP